MLDKAGIRYEIYPSDNAIPRSELSQHLSKNRYDGIITTLSDRIDAELLDLAGKQLKIVANYAVGYGNIDIAECSKRSVAVSNTPGVLSAATADMAFTLLLATARRIFEGSELIQKGKWKGWAPNQLLGQGVSGKTLGIIGMGRIGEEMAKRALGFDMKVVYHNRNRNLAAEERLSVSYLGFEELLQQSEFISLHMPLTEQTHHLIGKKQFALMKENVILVNTARGAVIDEKELVKALQQGKIWGAGLDVFEFEPKITEELKTMKNVVLAPHLGTATKGTRDAMIELTVSSIKAVFDGEISSNILNPEVLQKA